MGGPSLQMTLPPATTAGVQVSARFDSSSVYPYLMVVPDGSDTINGAAYFLLETVGQCVIFIVGEAGKWWVLSNSFDVADGDLSGTYPAPTVIKLEGYAVAATQPIDGYALTWDPGGGATWKSDKPIPGGDAGGDLSGTYPRPTVAKIEGYAVIATRPTDGYALTWNNGSSQWQSLHTIDGITVGLPPTGIASDKGISTTDTNTILSLWGTRSSGATNISTAIVADVNSATIDSGHKVVQIGWVNDVNLFTELFNFKDSEFQISTSASAKLLSTDTDGASIIAVSLGSSNSLTTDGAKLLSVVNGSPDGLERMYVDYAGNTVLNKGNNSQYLGVKYLTESYTVPATVDGYSTFQIPANVLIIGVSVRILTTIPTATTFSIGVTLNKTKYGTGISVNAGTENVNVSNGITYNSSGISLLITPNATPATATGVMRITVNYFEIVAPTG